MNPAAPSVITAARAPTRIDFGGGWTDVPPYPEEQGGFVCNLAIARYAVAHVVPRSNRLRSHAGTHAGDNPDVGDDGHSAELALARAVRARAGISDSTIHLVNDFPIGSGLGGSSSAGVAALGALETCHGRTGWSDTERAAIAERSRQVEVEDLRVAGGRQDHYAAAFGGALGLEFDTSVRVNRIPLSRELAIEMAQRCTLVYTGQSRISGDTIRAVLDAYAARESRVTTALKRMAALARSMAIAILSADLDTLAALVDEHWAAQRALHPSITTPDIDRILDLARGAGAGGGKALGASGGGCVVVLAPAERASDVRRAVASAGTVIPFDVDHDGLAVVSTPQSGEHK